MQLTNSVKLSFQSAFSSDSSIRASTHRDLRHTHTHTHTECCLITICWANHNKSNVQFRPLVEFLVTDYIFVFNQEETAVLSLMMFFYLSSRFISRVSEYVRLRAVSLCFRKFRNSLESSSESPSSYIWNTQTQSSLFFTTFKGIHLVAFGSVVR